MYKKNEILYDCYDKDRNYIGIIFAMDCKELLEICPIVSKVCHRTAESMISFGEYNGIKLLEARL